MRAALGCLALLAVLLGGAFFYSAQMARTAENFAEHTAALANSPADERKDMIDQLEEEWKQKELLFSLSVPHSELDRVETEFVHVASAAETKDGGEFQLAVALLSAAFEHIGKLYEASLDNIL